MTELGKEQIVACAQGAIDMFERDPNTHVVGNFAAIRPAHGGGHPIQALVGDTDANCFCAVGAMASIAVHLGWITESFAGRKMERELISHGIRASQLELESDKGPEFAIAALKGIVRTLS